VTDPRDAERRGPDSPAARALVRSPLSDGEWQRLHPLTPLLRGGLFLLVIIGVIVANLRERLFELFLPAVTDLPPGVLPPDPVDFILANNLILIVGGGALAVLIVLLVIFRLSWRFHTFRISDDDVEVRSGVLFRTHRRAPLDRVQGVNLTRPMVARLLGLAKLEVVGAGLDSNVKLEYLSAKAAETVRGDILRLASGRRLAERGVAAAPAGSAVQQAADAVAAGIQGIVDGEDFSDAEPESIVRIPFGRLVASRVLSGSTLMLVALIVDHRRGLALDTVAPVHDRPGVPRVRGVLCALDRPGSALFDRSDLRRRAADVRAVHDDQRGGPAGPRARDRGAPAAAVAPVRVVEHLGQSAHRPGLDRLDHRPLRGGAAHRHARRHRAGSAHPRSGAAGGGVELRVPRRHPRPGGR
jgi:membrane protein YdbS with pleckstrin-like domain